MWKIPAMRPKLPATERLMDYLRRIDQSRFYSNFGPLVCALEERLAAHYRVSSGNVTTVANATQGLTLALVAQGVKQGTLCAMPAWTFVASVHAAVNAGLVPYFLDVDAETWVLDAAAVAEEIARALATVGR
jgi:dTDP-4-amino-4,6-dideoxygalactose transaminase